MRWIVDASNVIGARPDGWWHDRARARWRLLDEVARWREAVGAAVTLVCDGHPDAYVPEQRQHGVDVVYAHSNARDAADDVIVGLVAGTVPPVTVATSDRELRRRVEARGATTVGARRFRDAIADIEARRSDRRVLSHFGADESTLLGRGGEARVFAVDDERVLRLPHPGATHESLDRRAALIEALPADVGGVALPHVLEDLEVERRRVVVERRLPGEDALVHLGRPDTDREALVRHHLEVCRSLGRLAAPHREFGSYFSDVDRTDSFATWSERALARSRSTAGDDFADLDPVTITEALLAALPAPEPAQPRLVHLDAFLGNMLAVHSRITAVLDFGPMTIGGPPDLDALVAIAYLASEITPTADDRDRAIARVWAAEHDLAHAVEPAERWIATLWTAALDDPRLDRWCRRILT